VEHDADFVGVQRFQTASQLAFAMDDPQIAAITPRRSGFDDWFDAEAHRGQSAIVLTDGRDNPAFWQTQFTGVTKLRTLRIVHAGQPVNTYELFFATEYRPDGAKQ
jgi:hypothetical protein